MLHLSVGMIEASSHTSSLPPALEIHLRAKLKDPRVQDLGRLSPQHTESRHDRTNGTGVQHIVDVDIELDAGPFRYPDHLAQPRVKTRNPALPHGLGRDEWNDDVLHSPCQVAAKRRRDRRVARRVVCHDHRARQVLVRTAHHEVTRQRKIPEQLELGLRLERRDNMADRKSTRLNSSHSQISYAVFCLKKKK